MSISQNEGMEAARAVTVFDPKQQDKSRIEEKQYDNPDERDIQSSESKTYVVSLTNEAVKRNSDTTESHTDESNGGEALAAFAKV